MFAMKVKVAALVISGTVHLTSAGPDLRGRVIMIHCQRIITWRSVTSWGQRQPWPDPGLEETRGSSSAPPQLNMDYMFHFQLHMSSSRLDLTSAINQNLLKNQNPSPN